MRKLLLGSAAFAVMTVGPAVAADLPVRGPVYKSPPPVVYSWTGFYGGVNVGYSWGRQNNNWTVPAFFTVSESQNMNGFIGGVQWGYNWQIRQLGGRHGIGLPGVRPARQHDLLRHLACTTTATAGHKLPWFGTSRTRLGYLPSQYVLLYATGGLAYGQVKSDYTLYTGGVGVANANFKDVRAGYTVGAGIEGALGGGWTAKVEYLWVDLGKSTETTTVGGVLVSTFDSRVTDNIVRVGLNYKLGGGY